MNATATARSQAPQLPAAFASLPVTRIVSADFRRNTLTFDTPPGMVVGSGQYAIVSPTELLKALADTGLPEAGSLVVSRSARDGAAVYCENDGYRSITVPFVGGYVYLQTSRDEQPTRWYGQESRQDSQGRCWHTALSNYVIDDFGSLVPTEGGAA